MKLYNHTWIPDKILRALLIAAAKFAGCKHDGVAVKVTCMRINHGRSGMAMECDVVDARYMRGESRHTGKPQWIDTDGGYVTLQISAGWWWKARAQGNGWEKDLREAAEGFVLLAVHEFKHVADFQHNRKWSNRHNKLPFAKEDNVRRAKWGQRPEEIRAMDAEYDAVHSGWLKRQKLQVLRLVAAAYEHWRNQ